MTRRLDDQILAYAGRMELIVVILLVLVLFGGVTWGPVPSDGNLRSILYGVLAVLVVFWLLGYTGTWRYR